MHRQVGRWENPGEYVKDFFFLKEGGTYHLFYNVGTAGEKQDWNVPGNEDSFGHATSSDLGNWETHERVMHAVPRSWEGQVVSAPSILKVADVFKMIYTGFSDSEFGSQAIGLAESRDLFHWKRYAGNPVYTGPAWTDWTPTGWADCRDAHVIRADGCFYMYTTVRARENRGAVAIARSVDLKHWEDLGAAMFVDAKNEEGVAKVPESPTVFERNGLYYMLHSQGGLHTSPDPSANGWQQHRFEWPSPGFWAGPEVLEDGGRYVLAVFDWRMNGNEIRFWEIEWQDDLPLVRW